MAKYRPIDIRLWNDRKFLSLSDDGRMLWLFLLSTPQSMPIPGVIVAGQAAIAELLGWSSERLGEGFGELFQKGLSISAEGRLVWLRNALNYQPPTSPNVITGWAKTWDDVPEGSLKHELWQALKIACKRWDRTFLKLFPEPSRHGSEKGIGKGSGNGYRQEQEQEQEQEREESVSAPQDVESGTATPPSQPPEDRRPIAVQQSASVLHLPISTRPKVDPTHRGIALRMWEHAAVEHGRLKARGIGQTARPWIIAPDVSGAPFEALTERISELETGARERVTHRIAIAVVEAEELGHLDYFTPTLLWRKDQFYTAEGMSVEQARSRARTRRAGKGTAESAPLKFTFGAED